MKINKSIKMEEIIFSELLLLRDNIDAKSTNDAIAYLLQNYKDTENLKNSIVIESAISSIVKNSTIKDFKTIQEVLTTIIIQNELLKNILIVTGGVDSDEMERAKKMTHENTKEIYHFKNIIKDSIKKNEGLYYE